MKLNFKVSIYIILFYVFMISSCKKDENFVSSGILGPETVCLGEQEVEYSISFDSPVDYVLWSVPSDAEIVSGQGSNKIIVNFGPNTGKITAQLQKNNQAGKLEELNINFNCQVEKICRIKDFPGFSRSSAFSFSSGNKAYIGGGYGLNASNSATEYFTDLWEFDHSSQTWNQKASFINYSSRLFSNNNQFTFQGSYYVFSNTFSSSGYQFLKYDPQTNSWGSRTSLSNVDPQGATCFTIGSKAYLCCGDNIAFITPPIGSSYYTKNVYEYDPLVDTWIQKNDFPGSERTNSKGFSLGADGYLIGGYNSINNGSSNTYINLKEVWKYNPSNDSWIQQIDLPVIGSYPVGYYGFDYYAVTVSGNSAYLISVNDINNDNSVFKYNPIESNSWEKIVLNSTTFAVGFSMFSIGNTIYFGLGSNNQSIIGNPYSKKFYKFCVD